jgi:molybdenum cofactor synthesis domain-containing protein
VISLDEARGHVKLNLPHPVAETTAIQDALGRVLVDDVVASEPVPPFANSGMDGFAVIAADTAGATEGAPRRLPIVGTIAAGSPPEPAIHAGQAVRIMTGAPVPAGADAVVMVEMTRTVNGEPQVEILAEVAAGTAVRHAGEDVAIGDVVVRAGTVLRPAHLGVLANVGIREVATYRPARVGVVSTGDELVADGRPLGPGQIRESNRPMLLGLLAEAGCVPVDLGCVEDDNAAITEVLTRGARECDAILSSGGVSMGDFDLVKVVLDRLGAMRWMQIAIKPAKPFAFGTIGGTPVFGLPGNPVSSLVSFELLARPALLAMAGVAEPDRPRLLATAPDGFRRRPDGKTHFVRVVVTRTEEGFEARTAGAQGSHQLTATAEANGLAVVPDGDGIQPGGEVGVVVLDPARVFEPLIP